MTALDVDGVDLVAEWLGGARGRQSRVRARSRPEPGELRFAFYGRISTTDYQDRASSRQWQRDSAAELIAAHGAIVAEFFDVGVSRRRAWDDRTTVTQSWDTAATG